MSSSAEGRGARSLGLRAAFTLLGAFFVLALAATPALAERTQTATFDGSDTDAGAFSDLNRTAIHQASGSVYVIDAGNQVVDKFNFLGEAKSFQATGSSSLDDPGTGDAWDLSSDSDVAVDNSGTATDGRIYVLSAQPFSDQDVFAFDSAGNHLFTIQGDPEVASGSDICGVSVDPGGDLWISDFSSATVYEFDSSGSATGNTVDTSAQGSPCHSEIDSAGNLYVAMWNGPVHKYDLASGSHLGQVDPGSNLAVATDPATDHVFAVRSDRVIAYSPQGAKLARIGVGDLTSAIGGAGAASGALYVADTGEELVRVFSTPRTQTATFDGSDTDAGAFSDLNRTAIHQASGSVYVIDAGNQVVDKFNFLGEAKSFQATGSSSLDDPGTGDAWDLSSDSDVAVDNSGTATDGNLYVLSAQPFGDQDVFAFDSAGNHLFTIQGDPDVASGSDICGVSVDPGGDIWISDFASATVYEFDSSGSATGSTVDASAQGSPCHSAIDSAGNLYVAMWNGPVHKYDLASGSHLGQVDPGSNLAVATDPATDHVFAVRSDRVIAYSSQGAKLARIGVGDLTSAIGGAGAANGALYVADTGEELVRVFSTPRTQTATFDGSDTDAGAFSDLNRTAIHQASGSVYVIDAGNQVVDKFNFLGEAKGFQATGSSSLGDPGTGDAWDLSADSDIAVDDSGTATDGRIYVLSAQPFSDQDVFAFDSAGNHLFTIQSDPDVASGSDICGASVDSGGDIWISDFASATVYEFDSSGSATGNTVDTSGQGSPCHSAIDSAGNLYVAMWNGPVHKYDLASGSHLGQIDPGSNLAVATDPATDEVFAVRSDRVIAYSSQGAKLARIGVGDLTSAIGGAGAASGALYVSDTGEELVRVFDFAAAVASPPTATIAPVSDITSSSATLNGTVNPGGPETSYQFEYRPASDPDWSGATSVPVPAGEAGDGTSPVAVSEPVTGLDPDTDYLVRLVATNSQGTATSAEEAFRTLAPPTAAIDPVADITADGASFSGTVNPGGAATSYRFEYRPASDPDWSGASRVPVPDDGDTGSGTADVAVAEAATGLEADTDYLVRLVATNSEGTATSAEEAFRTLPPEAPTVRIAPATDIRPTSAVVNGTVSPGGAPTSWHFEYRPAADPDWSAATSVPVPDAEVDGGLAEVTVAEFISGLNPETDYLVRLVATNSAGSATSGERSFRTGSVPVERAYEQVTRGDKKGVDLEMRGVTMVSSSGERIYFTAPGAFAGSASSTGVSSYLADRGTGGWSTQPLDPPVPLVTFPGVRYYGFTGDLSTALFLHTDPPELVVGEPSGNRDLYLRREDGSHSLVTDRKPGVSNVTKSPAGVVPWISRDLTHVLFDPPADTAYTPDDNEHMTYYANAATGEVSYFSFVPDESTADPDDEIPAGRVGGSFRSVAAGAGVKGVWKQGSVSEDGSRVFFTVSESFSSSPTEGAQIYVRKARGTPSAHTVRVSAPEPGVTDPIPETFAAWFRAASSDGSRVFFTSCERLTADSTADSSGGSTFFRGCAFPDIDATQSDLYMFDVDAEGGDGDLADLTGTEMTVNDDTSVPADVLGFVGAAEDGSRAYFVARGNLTADASGSGPKLYLWEQGAGLRLVATLVPEDMGGGGTAQGDIWAAPTSAQKQARVTPDGEHLAFASFASLAPGFDSAGHRQVYLYDAAQDSLVCASCVGSGPARADASIARGEDRPETARIVQRNLTDGGRLAFFETTEALLPRRDRNAKVDVYGYDAEGGGVFLVSSGNSGYGSRFANASPDGDDVFFRTRERLVGSDTDDLVDIYDARIGGGFPEPPPPEPACEGDECQGEVPEPPADEPIGSKLGGLESLDACQILQRRQAVAERRSARLAHRTRALQRRTMRLRRMAHRAEGRRAQRLARRARVVRRRAWVLRRHAVRIDRRAARLAQGVQRCKSEGEA